MSTTTPPAERTQTRSKQRPTKAHTPTKQPSPKAKKERRGTVPPFPERKEGRARGGTQVGLWRGTAQDRWPAERWEEREGDCNAPTIKGKGPPCRKRAGWNTSHLGIGRCERHLGTTRNHEKAARRVLAAQAVQALGLGSRELDVSPSELLLHCNRVAAFDCELLERMLGSLELEPDSSGFVKVKNQDGEEHLEPMRPELKALYGPTYHLTGVWTGEGKPHPYWEMHEAAQKRAIQVSSICLKLKLKDEEVKANTLMAQAVADSHRALVAALGHSLQDPTVKAAMRQALTLVAGAQAAE